jgi:hypothetical protein
MDIFRILVVIFLVMHGIGHIIWFLAAWTPIDTGVKDGRWVLPGNVTIRSPLGKLLGLVALLATLVFVGAGVGLIMGQLWWASWTYVGIFISFAAVVPWIRQSPGWTPVNAIVADLALLFVITLFAADLVAPA